MTPAARVQAAIEVLDSILEGTPAEKALTNWARSARFAGSGDRAALRDHVFQALRCRRSHAVLGGALTGRGLMIGAMRDQGVPLSDIFTGAGYGPAPLSAEEAVERSLCDPDRFDLPDWLWPLFEASLGDAAAPTALALRRRAPVVLRVNLARSDPAAVIADLDSGGIVALPDDIAPGALIVTEGARRITAHPLYQSGVIELQDGSSQAAMHLLPLPENGRVLDFCAGGGGKTLALAARGQADWFAHDALVQRMQDLPLRAARAGVTVTLLATDELAVHAPFDLVLCDVPCSGSGTWRRTPEAKWALTPGRLNELTRQQAEILARAASLVTPGGVLAYATCSVLRAENEDRIAAFLAENPGWRRDLMQRWPVSAAGDGFFVSSLSCNNS